ALTLIANRRKGLAGWQLNRLSVCACAHTCYPQCSLLMIEIYKTYSLWSIQFVYKKSALTLCICFLTEGLMKRIALKA
ncbi:hypothetical protein, partial [Enterobacter hormaechei]|uniref:hypothetical protein n=1 Tax=Enterobacter hormaechei TaxID=158836 RepID=UPI003D6E934F